MSESSPMNRIWVESCQIGAALFRFFLYCRFEPGASQMKLKSFTILQRTYSTKMSKITSLKSESCQKWTAPRLCSPVHFSHYKSVFSLLRTSKWRAFFLRVYDTPWKFAVSRLRVIRLLHSFILLYILVMIPGSEQTDIKIEQNCNFKRRNLQNYIPLLE
jgi:hypothetical protein